jgi:hypothetical protein
MSTFTDAVTNQTTTTTNGMKAHVASGNACTDLFFKIGASRGQNIIPSFVAALAENEDYAIRIAQWARDIRGGAGERKIFKDILVYLSKANPTLALRLMQKVPEIGRWDDLLVKYEYHILEQNAANLIKGAIEDGNGLAAKWAPRKGDWALKLRKIWNMSPKAYRKFIVNASKTVEQQMCAKQWDDINFSHVPSLAASRYRTAFYRNAEARYTEYIEKLKSGDTSVKVNAGAVYPYDVLKNSNVRNASREHAIAQWAALENFIGDANILPMVDVSGSMMTPAGNSTSLSCMDVAVSLGLYCAEKNNGKFQDVILTFSANPQLMQLQGDIIQKCEQLKRADWGMNTDLNRAFEQMLRVAKEGNVPASEMPEILLILSDMQFDSSQDKGWSRGNEVTVFNESAIEMIKRQYNDAGYTMPQVVFWNLNAHDNCPVKFNELGTAMVSGFSPAIMKSVLAADFEEFTPEAIMLQTILSERYNY